MARSLLTTKLYKPPVSPTLVPRPRLIDTLNEGLRLDRRLTLVSAPAGFGKTTLVSDWLHSVDRPSAWLSLDGGDNDPARFLTYLLAALQTVDPAIGRRVQERLDASEPPAMEALLTGLVNDITATGDSSLLILDDYHAIGSAPVHRIVTFLLEHLHPGGGLHLVIATRSDPPLPVARLRAEGRLTELRGADLRFTATEVAIYLNETMKLALSADHLAALEERTEGWIAGLQLAALSLQRHDDVARFVQAFAGSQRYVLDYLTEEILNRQPAKTQEFLLQTAVLDRLTGPLCDAVTGESRGAQTLEALEAANLFIIPLDEERRWYRYHRLFGDLLRQRLGREQPDQIPELHRRAGQWYEEQGLYPDAVSHVLAAGDVERAADLIDWIGWGMLARGEMVELLGWLETLPTDLVDTQPRLEVLRAWALALTGQWDRLQESWGEQVDGYVPGELDALHAYLASVRGDVPRTIELGRRARERLPKAKWFSRAIAALSLGIAHFARGQPVPASQALSEAIELNRAGGPTYMALAAMMTLGHVQELGGALRAAVQTLREALEVAAGSAGARPVPLTGMAHVGLADVQYEWDQLDRALRNALTGIDLTSLGGFTSYQLAGYARLTQIYQARGDFERAAETLRQAEQLVAGRPYAYLAGRLIHLRVRLWLAQGELTAAERWLEAHSLGRDEEIDLAREAEQLAAARVLLALDRPTEALAVLGPVLAAADKAGRRGAQIESLTLQTLAWQRCGDMERSLKALGQALKLGEPEGYIRTLIGEGAPMAELLRRALVRGLSPGYAARLLTTLGDPAEVMAPAMERLVEPLTERELEVLRLVAGGLTNREIAAELVVAVSTVKSHVNHIYGKLEVKNRTQASVRARELGLL
jgi:LuxR family maltose regulon positive regulatory protein